jgi:hypothetical protein
VKVDVEVEVKVKMEVKVEVEVKMEVKVEARPSTSSIADPRRRESACLGASDRAATLRWTARGCLSDGHRSRLCEW